MRNLAEAQHEEELIKVSSSPGCLLELMGTPESVFQITNQHCVVFKSCLLVHFDVSCLFLIV